MLQKSPGIILFC